MSGYRTPAAPLRALAETLAVAGVRDVVICPGSRSTPLALALRAHPHLRCWVHLDERAGAFFALGAAKASRRPVAVLATSGTAVVNFGPAVTEARYGRVPLVLLTADRPPELQGRGAPQTIDQVELFGRHAKWYAEIAVPEATAASTAQVHEVVALAVAQAVAAPAGPVQVNLPLREPLLPDGSLLAAPADLAAPAAAARPTPRSTDVELVAAAIRGAQRGLIVCGPQDVPGFPPAVTRLAAVAGLPLLADGLSNLRQGPHDRSHLIVHHDALLRSATVRDWPAPDLVLRFGAGPTSKALGQLLDSLSAPQFLIDDGGGWQRPPEPVLLTADPVVFAEQLAAELLPAEERPPADAASAWLDRWQAAAAAAAAALEAWRADRTEPFEGAPFEVIAAALPAAAILFVGNSMPVRDLDSFLPSSVGELRVLGNRGANGIDGLISTALGSAAAQERPVVAVVGDVSFLHDLNALVAARRLGISATIVLVNNDGGGIFSFLPQASADRPDRVLPLHYEELFGTPHGTDFGPLVRALGAGYVLAAGDDELRTVLRHGVEKPGLQVVEMRTDRARNVRLHREALAVVSQALEGSA